MCVFVRNRVQEAFTVLAMLFLDMGTSYTSVFTCENSSSRPLKMSAPFSTCIILKSHLKAQKPVFEFQLCLLTDHVTSCNHYPQVSDSLRLFLHL